MTKMIVEEVDKLIMIVYQVIVNVVKFVWAGESQGRAASLPAALVPHLAERREKAAMVAEVRLLYRVLLNLQHSGSIGLCSGTMLVFFKPFFKVSVMVLKFKSLSFSLTMNQTLKSGLVDTVIIKTIIKTTTKAVKKTIMKK